MQSSATADPIVLIIVMSVVTPLLVLLYLYPPSTRSLRAWSSRRVASSGLADKVYRKLPKYLVIMGGCAKILLGYCQCLSAVQRFQLIVWPDIFYRFMEILDEVNIEFFSTVPAECITGSRLGFFDLRVHPATARTSSKLRASCLRAVLIPRKSSTIGFLF